MLCMNGENLLKENLFREVNEIFRAVLKIIREDGHV